jgi:hypothetical protein
LSETYRGYTVPEIIQDGDLYFIADEEVGWFNSMTPKIVLLHWQNKVDSKTKAQYIENGWFEPHGNDHMCTKCGSLVIDLFRHVKICLT